MKSRPDFLPPKALLLAGEVMALNENKHPNQRWKTMTDKEHVGAAMRHILKWLSGEGLDPETGKSHLIHGLCRMAMAAEQEDTKFDDGFGTPSPMTPQVGDRVRVVNYRDQYVAFEGEEGTVEKSGTTFSSIRGDNEGWFDIPHRFVKVVKRPEYEAYLDGKLEQCPIKKGKAIDEYTEQEWNEGRI